MKAFITSIGEPTTELSLWALERLGYDVIVVRNNDSLAKKLEWIYNYAEGDFLRVDADVIPNRNVLKLSKQLLDGEWWVQPQTFDWYKQDLAFGGVQFIKKEALPLLRRYIASKAQAERPESEMFRLPEFHNPRRCVSVEMVCGLNGWGQQDLSRVKEVKRRRNQSQNYDWDLVERMI